MFGQVKHKNRVVSKQIIYGLISLVLCTLPITNAIDRTQSSDQLSGNFAGTQSNPGSIFSKLFTWFNPFALSGTKTAALSAAASSPVASAATAPHPKTPIAIPVSGNRRDTYGRQQQYRYQNFHGRSPKFSGSGGGAAANKHSDVNCNPCNDVPWIPVAAPVRDSKSIVGFVHPSEINTNYGPPVQTSNVYGFQAGMVSQYEPPVDNYGAPQPDYPFESGPQVQYGQPYAQSSIFPHKNKPSLQYLPVSKKPAKSYSYSYMRGPSFSYGMSQPHFKIPATSYGVPIESTKFQLSTKDFASKPYRGASLSYQQQHQQQHQPNIWLAPPSKHNQHDQFSSFSLSSASDDSVSASSQYVLSQPPVPFPNMSPFQILPIFEHGNDFAPVILQSRIPSHKRPQPPKKITSDIIIDINENKIKHDEPISDIQIVQSIPIADYTSSIQHPINYIQSPIIDLTVPSTNTTTTTTTFDSPINVANDSSSGSDPNLTSLRWHSQPEKQSKNVQIIVPYAMRPDEQTPEPARKPNFGRKVHTTDDYFDAQGSASNLDILKLQHNIDKWTVQEFNNEINSQSDGHHFKQYHQSITKAIPNEFLATTASFSPKATATTTTTTSKPTTSNTTDWKTSTISQWNRVQLAISPVTNETVYVVTPMQTSTEALDNTESIVKSKIISFREWPSLINSLASNEIVNEKSAKNQTTTATNTKKRPVDILAKTIN